MSQDRSALDARAYAVMLLLTALWGFQQVTVKAIATDVSLVMQAAVRSALACALLLAWARLRGIALFGRDGTLWPGLVAGVLFGAEFVFIYAGLGHTNASRMSVFIYLAPPLTALGLHFFVHGERLVARQWLGVAVAFGGIVLAFGEGFLHGRSTLLGDLCGIVAAALWAATTVVIRATSLSRASAEKTLFYQLAVSALMLPVASAVARSASTSSIWGRRATAPPPDPPIPAPRGPPARSGAARCPAESAPTRAASSPAPPTPIRPAHTAAAKHGRPQGAS